MSSLNPCPDSLTSYTLHHDYWNDEPQASTNILDSIDSTYYDYLPNNGEFLPFGATFPTFSPPKVSPSSLLPLFNPQPSLVSQTILHDQSGFNPYNPVFTPHIPAPYPPTVPTYMFTSVVQSAPTTASPATTLVSIPAVAPTTFISQSSSSICPPCSKLCVSHPRTDTCLFDHIGTKPFACNGDCGIEDW
jgi:hypothetical protein